MIVSIFSEIKIQRQNYSYLPQTTYFTIVLIIKKMSQKRYRKQKNAKQKRSELHSEHFIQVFNRTSLMEYHSPCDFSHPQPQHNRTHINKTQKKSYSYNFNIPERIMKTTSEPQYMVEKLGLSRQNNSEGCDEQPQIQKYIQQHSTPNHDYLSPIVKEKIQILIISLLLDKREQDNIQKSQAFYSNLRQQLIYIKNQYQTYQNLAGSCKKIRQNLGDKSLDTLLLPQYLHYRRIIKELFHILVQTRQDQQWLNVSITKIHDLCLGKPNLAQSNSSIKSVEQWITLYIFANNYYYNLQKEKVHHQIENIIKDSQQLNQIYQLSTIQRFRRSTCQYVHHHLDKMLSAISHIYETVPLYQKIKEMMEVYKFWTHEKKKQHQQHSIQYAFEKAIAQEWLKRPNNLLYYLLTAATTFPESSLYHHTLFHPSGGNLLRFFRVISQLNNIIQRLIGVREQDLSLATKFAKQSLKQLEVCVGSLEWSPAKCIHYDIYKTAILLSYAYAQTVGLEDLPYLQAETLNNIKCKIEDKLQVFIEKFEALRYKDQKISTEEADQLEKTIAQCQTIDRFLKQAKRQVQNKDLASEKLLFRMIRVIRENFMNGSKYRRKQRLEFNQ